MTSITRIIFIFLIATTFSIAPVNAQHATAEAHALKLSPPLLELLRAEMRAILTGVQSLPESIATADWKSVADTGAQISESYIFAQKITPAQRKELSHSLPEYFKKLDSGFHLEAKKLEAAAYNHDAQLVTFHYYRLIETCTSCHAAYATSKFPGFAPAMKDSHHH